MRDSVPDALVYGITRALFNPANRDALAASHPSAREIGLATAALNPPAPLHPGAARYYPEARARCASARPTPARPRLPFCDAFSQACIAGSAQIRSI